MPQADGDVGLLRSRSAEQIERFVAFAFAAADLVAEVEPDGTVTYAAGAFRSRLGRAPDEVIGQNLRGLVVAADGATVELGLELLRTRGRLPPVIVRLAARGQPQLALAGLALGPPGGTARYCMTFAPLPNPADAEIVVSPELLRRTVATAGEGLALSSMALIEVEHGTISAAEIACTLRSIAPDFMTSELAPGRFGVLGSAGRGELAATIGQLEAALQTTKGAGLVSRELSAEGSTMTASQAARALGQALITFSRDGVDGLERSGFGGGLGAYMTRAASQTNALRRAIEQRRFELMFQPVVSLADRRLHHYEALIRPEASRGAASPQEFVLMVEMLGLSHELDLAVAQLAAEAALLASAPIAFNLSGQSIDDAEFRDRLVALLQASPSVRGRRLLIEMTETAEVGNIEEAVATVRAIRELGIAFCLDDFGAGAADLRALRALGADYVKLDGSFVPGITAGGRERAFVAGIMEVARAAGAAVVAERVETEAEAAALLEVGAAYGQGWLFGKPAPLPRRQDNFARRSGERETWG